MAGLFLYHIVFILLKIPQFIDFGIIIAVDYLPNRRTQTSMITAHEATANHSIYN